MAESRRSPVARLIVGLVTVPVAVIVVLFALSNREPNVVDCAETLAGDVGAKCLQIELLPFPIELKMPVYMLALSAVVLGVLAGGFITWLSGHAWRRRAREAERVRRALEQEISGLRRQLQTARRKALESAEAALPAPEATEQEARSTELVEADRPH